MNWRMKMNIENMKDELVEDCLDTCLSDTGYLKSIIQSYYNSYSDDNIVQIHNDAFGDRP